jgi:hypothetical protein
MGDMPAVRSSRNCTEINGSRTSTHFQFLSACRSRFARERVAPILNLWAILRKLGVVSRPG